MIPRISVLVLICAAAMAAFACGSGSDDDDATPTAASQASSTASAGETATPATVDRRIRDVNIALVPDVQSVTTDTGGFVAAGDVQYGDLTGDRVEEAAVPVSSGGTRGNIAFLVLTPADAPADGNTETLLSELAAAGGGLVLAIDAGKLVVTEPIFGPDDPECCPTDLQRTIYGWNGSALVVEDQSTEDNPDAGVKETPQAD
jgi:hypothetical protein